MYRIQEQLDEEKAHRKWMETMLKEQAKFSQMPHPSPPPSPPSPAPEPWTKEDELLAVAGFLHSFSRGNPSTSAPLPPPPVV